MDRIVLSERKQRVTVGEYVSLWLTVLSGVPQGSVLGPLLFLFFVNYLIDELVNVAKLNADDTKLLKQPRWARLRHGATNGKCT
jgi:ribonuclease P/MRP protein subunit RPP40